MRLNDEGLAFLREAFGVSHAVGIGSHEAEGQVAQAEGAGVALFSAGVER
jgi:hypothetical protein